MQRATSDGQQKSEKGATKSKATPLSRGSFQLNLASVRGAASSEGSDSDSRGNSPEHTFTPPRGSSGGQTGVVAHSQETVNGLLDLIIDACEYCDDEYYAQNYLEPLYSALGLTYGVADLSSQKLRQICEQQKKRPGQENCLHRAARFGAVEVVRLLLANGYDACINSEFDGQTPLSYAVFFQDGELISVFYEYGPENLLGAALYFYEHTRKKIEYAQDLINQAESVKRKEAGSLEGMHQPDKQSSLSLDTLYLFYSGALEYDAILSDLGAQRVEKELIPLLENLPKDQLKEWVENAERPDVTAIFDQLDQLQDFCKTHNINIDQLCGLYYYKFQYLKFFDSLPEALGDKLEDALAIEGASGVRPPSTVLKGYQKILESLVEKLAQSPILLRKAWPNNLTPLQMCAQYRDKNQFSKILLQFSPENIKSATEVFDGNGNSLLHLAVAGTDLSIPSEKEFLTFIMRGYPEFWNKVNFDDHSPLSLACFERNEALIRLMAEQSKEIQVTQTYLKGQALTQAAAQALSAIQQERQSEAVRVENKTYELKILLQLNGHRYPSGWGDDKQPYVAPLEDAAELGNDDVVSWLLELWPDESHAIFEAKKEGNPYLTAIKQERNAVLNSVEDNLKKDRHFQTAKKEWGLVQNNILRFIHSSNSDEKKDNSRKRFVSNLITLVRNDIKQVNDENLKQSLSHMLTELQSDYQLLVTDVQTDRNNEYSDEDICKIGKIFYLMNELSELANVGKVKKQTTEQWSAAKERFEKSCSAELSTEISDARYTEILCIIVGMIIGASVGFLAGTLLTLGGPGGFWLALPSAEYGAVVGGIVGAAIGGVAGKRCAQSGDSSKWQRGLWAISGAMSQVKTDDPIRDEEAVPLLG